MCGNRYVYIYLSNDNGQPLEVFFDDFTVEHSHSAIVQADDYYPFGLTFNEYRREKGMMNRYLYHSKELSLKTSSYDFHARMYDHSHSAIVQADDYYPFGMTFNEYRRENGMMNRYLYHSKELSLKTSSYDFHARMYDPVLGRTFQIDPQ